jgi:hypothetical protein
MMKRTLVWGLALTVVALTSPLGADELWNNGPLVTHPGGGFGGADASRLLNTTFGENILGYGHQATAGNAVADDFTILDPAGWHIDSITFYAYQTSRPPGGALTVNLDITAGPPVGLPAGTYSGSPGAFANIYRDSETSVGSSTRAINAVTVPVDADFGPGTYWLSWNAIGDAAFSGPWAPPVSYPDAVNGPNPLGQMPNGSQYTSTTLAWNPVQDSGSLTPDEFPFIINGSVVPEPGSCTLLLLAASGLLAFRRR